MKKNIKNHLIKLGVHKEFELEEEAIQNRKDQGFKMTPTKRRIFSLGFHDGYEAYKNSFSKNAYIYKLLCEEAQSLRKEFKEAKKIEITTGDKTRCNELEVDIKQVTNIIKFIDEQEGKWTDPQTGNYHGSHDQFKEKTFLDIFKPKESLVRIHGQEIELKEVETEIDISFTSWFMVCSYHQPHTKQRNYKNILIKQDQFPTLKECQKELEKVLGFEVEEVVLMNWKEVNNSYEL